VWCTVAGLSLSGITRTDYLQMNMGCPGWGWCCIWAYNWCTINRFVAGDTGISSRVCDVPQLLSWTAVWGGARLHVPTAAVSHSLPHTESSVWLRLRLDNIETESCEFSRCLRQPADRRYCRQVYHPHINRFIPRTNTETELMFFLATMLTLVDQNVWNQSFYILVVARDTSWSKD